MITYCFYISIFIVSSSYDATSASCSYDGVHRSASATATATGFVIDLYLLILDCLCRFAWYANATVTVTLTVTKGIRRSAFGSGSGSLYPVI